MDYRVWGLDPFGFRLTNLLLHFFNAVLLFFLAKKIFKSESIAFISSFFFAVYPAHVPAVAYVSGRADLLMFFFGMLLMLFFMYFREKGNRVLLSLSSLFFILAVFSKEYALIFLAIIPVMDLVLLRKNGEPARFSAYIPFAAVSILYVSAHYLFLWDKYAIFFPSAVTFPLAASKYVRIFGEFLLLSIFPGGLHFRHALTPGSLFFYLQVGMLISGMALILVSIGKMFRKLFFSLAAFFISLVPFIFVLDSLGVYAEHWMYLASAWILLFCSASLTGFYVRSGLKKKIFILVLIFTGIVLYSKTCISQALFFTDAGKLSDSITDSSADQTAVYFKSIDLYRKGRRAEASSRMDQMVELNPSNPRTRYLRGRLYLSLGKNKQARMDFEKAVEISPRYANAYVGLALYSFTKGDSGGGIRHLEKAVKLVPYHPEALTLLGMAYSDIGQTGKAMDIFYRSIKTDPFGYDEIVNMGTALTREGKVAEGCRYYLKAIKLYPESPVPYYNLAYLFYMNGDTKNAEFYASKAVLADPYYESAKELLRNIRNDLGS
jgi:Flp pilus assembly protein TadD